jgi:hypothetical protein
MSSPLGIKGFHPNGFQSDTRKGDICHVTIGRAACEAWNFGTNSAFALGPRKTTETLDRVGRSQDLPDANWFPASSPQLGKDRTEHTCCISFSIVARLLRLGCHCLEKEPLPSNGSLCWLHNFGSQQTCDNTNRIVIFMVVRNVRLVLYNRI